MCPCELVRCRERFATIPDGSLIGHVGKHFRRRAFTELPSLGSLNRKAAVDAGFDLEPGDPTAARWRLRASGAPGVVWVRPLVDGTGSLLALPLAAQLAELDPATGHPLYAKRGCSSTPARCRRGSSISIGARSSRRAAPGLDSRAHTPERLRAQWEADVTAVLTELGISASVPSTRPRQS